MWSDSPFDTALRSFGALSHPVRLQLFRLVMRRMPQATRPADILAVMDLRANTLSGYLSDLVEAQLLAVQRQGRELHYRIDVTGTSQIIDFFVRDCCRGRPELCQDLIPEARAMKTKPYNVLFVCSGNAARSLFAEAILNHEGGGRFVAYSAGTNPGEGPNPDAVALLQRNGYDTTPLRSKPLSAFQSADAPALDFVFTVCDRAAAEECAVWEGGPLTSHWPVADPVKATGNDASRQLAFAKAFEELRRRITLFAALSPESLDRASLQQRLDDISAS